MTIIHTILQLYEYITQHQNELRNYNNFGMEYIRFFYFWPNLFSITLYGEPLNNANFPIQTGGNNLFSRENKTHFFIRIMNKMIKSKMIERNIYQIFYGFCNWPFEMKTLDILLLVFLYKKFISKFYFYTFN